MLLASTVESGFSALLRLGVPGDRLWMFQVLWRELAKANVQAAEQTISMLCISYCVEESKLDVVRARDQRGVMVFDKIDNKHESNG